MKLKLPLLSTDQATTYPTTLKELLIGNPEQKAGKTPEATTSPIRTQEPDTTNKSP